MVNIMLFLFYHNKKSYLMPPPPFKKSFVSAKVLYEIKSLVIFFCFIKVAVLVR